MIEQKKGVLMEEWPSTGLESVKTCPVCGSNKRKEIYNNLTDEVFSCAPGRWNLYQCKWCKSAYLDPRPTADTIHLAYKSYYTHSWEKGGGSKKWKTFKKWIRSVANDYRNKRFGGNLRPDFPLGVFLIKALPKRRRMLDMEMRGLPPVWKGARLLDVGFGNGRFLENAGEVGWEVEGVDPDPVAVENARRRGLSVRQGGIEIMSDRKGCFDVVTLSHVIEHIHAPEECLKQACNLLKPKGLLYIDTPNIEALGHKKFGKHWRGLEIPRHLTIFSWPGLEKLLLDAGFGKVKKEQRKGVYPGLASASRAIGQWQELTPKRRPAVGDRLRGMWVDSLSKNNFRKREFITLYAYKEEN